MINRTDLMGEEVLTLDEHHLYHRQVTELCQTLGANTRRDFEGTSLDTLRQMVVMGMGITFLPALYVASEIRETDPLRVADVFGGEHVPRPCTCLATSLTPRVPCFGALHKRSAS